MVIVILIFAFIVVMAAAIVASEMMGRRLGSVELILLALTYWAMVYFLYP